MIHLIFQALICINFSGDSCDLGSGQEIRDWENTAPSTTCDWENKKAAGGPSHHYYSDLDFVMRGKNGLVPLTVVKLLIISL